MPIASSCRGSIWISSFSAVNVRTFPGDALRPFVMFRYCSLRKNKGIFMILVVDDHPDTVEFVCRFLQRKGYETECAANGEEALAFLETNTPRLIILDIQMPGLTGLQVIEAMQQDERLRNIPVLMYSAGHEQFQHDRAMQLGAKAYMVKGAISVAEILAQVARYATPVV
jgi:CheY-like chemotaxis protein